MRRHLATAAVLALALAACGSDDDTTAQQTSDAATATSAASEESSATPSESATGTADDGAEETGTDGQEFSLALTGDAEVPGPGADVAEPVTVDLEVVTGGDGAAQVVVASVSGADAVGEATGFHIHSGSSDASGPVVIDLGEALAGGEVTETTVEADATTVEQVLADPSGFYLNLHTPDFPAGAVRAQLG